jgi:dephospho-CoA kinase
MSQVSQESFPRRTIPVIGIVGGVGSGKSSVAKALAARAPVEIIDADRLGHRALELPEVKEALRRRFGDVIFDAMGTVIRGELAKLVFGDSLGAIAARKDLEAITHPEIGRLAHARIDEVQRGNAVRWIVLDAALLLEADWRRFCDLVVFVDVPDEIRMERVMCNRGWSREEWERREASQWEVAQKRSAADVVISNAGDVQSAATELQTELERRFSTGISQQ